MNRTPYKSTITCPYLPQHKMARVYECMIKITQYVTLTHCGRTVALINDDPDKNHGGSTRRSPKILPFYLLLIHFITINLFRVYCCGTDLKICRAELKFEFHISKRIHSVECSDSIRVFKTHSGKWSNLGYSSTWV